MNPELPSLLLDKKFKEEVRQLFWIKDTEGIIKNNSHVHMPTDIKRLKIYLVAQIISSKIEYNSPLFTINTDIQNNNNVKDIIDKWDKEFRNDRKIEKKRKDSSSTTCTSEKRLKTMKIPLLQNLQPTTQLLTQTNIQHVDIKKEKDTCIIEKNIEDNIQVPNMSKTIPIPIQIPILPFINIEDNKNHPLFKVLNSIMIWIYLNVQNKAKIADVGCGIYSMHNLLFQSIRDRSIAIKRSTYIEIHGFNMKESTNIIENEIQSLSFVPDIQEAYKLDNYQSEFDIVLFGFALYNNDIHQDLVKAQKALKMKGILIIVDYYNRWGPADCANIQRYGFRLQDAYNDRHRKYITMQFEKCSDIIDIYDNLILQPQQ